MSKKKEEVVLENQEGVEIQPDEEVPATEEDSKLNWKEAASKLKKLVEDNSIDTFFRKDEINALRDRYNNKERSEELFNQIMGV